MRGEALLSILAIEVNLVLGIYVISRGPRFRQNRLFFCISLALTIWGIGELVMRTAGPLSVEVMGSRIAALGWCLLGALFVNFALALTRGDRDLLVDKWWLYVLLYLPALVLLSLVLTSDLVFRTFVLKGGVYSEVGGPLRMFSKVYVILMILLGIGILFRFWRSTVDETARRRAGYVIVAALIPTIAGIVTELLMPAFGINQPVNALVFTPVMACIIAYAVTRRGLMSTLISAVGGTIVSITRDPVLLLGPTGLIETVNVAAQDFTGYEWVELHDRPLKSLIGGERDRSGVVSRILAGIEVEGAADCFIEDGIVVPVAVSSAPIKERGKRLIGSAVILHDMRDAVNLINAEDKANAAMLEAELEKQHSEELASIISVAAHELRHPATVFKGYAQTLLGAWDRLDEKSIEESLHAVDKAADRLSRLAEGLLEAARLESDGVNLTFGTANSGTIIEHAVAELRGRGLGTEYIRPVDGRMIVVKADERKIQMVICVLLDNAVKFSPADRPVSVYCEKIVGEAVFRVEDRGCGIPEEHRELIFERFYQVEDILHHSAPGLGLGLHVAKSIVEAHGGWIKVEPRAGGGSVFSFGIPGAIESLPTADSTEEDPCQGGLATSKRRFSLLQ
ncbi:MAG: sensor histidine kinase [Candidatus Geothermincolia bacterium]